jgi:hypothetical protein
MFKTKMNLLTPSSTISGGRFALIDWKSRSGQVSQAGRVWPQAEPDLRLAENMGGFFGQGKLRLNLNVQNTRNREFCYRAIVEDGG